MTTPSVGASVPKRNNRTLLIGCFVGLALICVCIVLAGGVGGGAFAMQKLGLLSGTNTPTPTKTPLPSPTLTRTFTPAPTATRLATATSTPTPSGQANWPIAFSDNFLSDTNNWGIGKQQPHSDDFGTYRDSIAGGKLRVEITGKRDVAKKYYPDAPVFGDQYVSVQARQLSGPKDAIHGLVFRFDEENNYYYMFGIRADQNYAVFAHQDNWSTLVDWTPATAIQSGQQNRLAVLAQGAQLSFFVNDQKVGQIVDSRFSKGQAGVIMELEKAGAQAVFEFSNYEVRAPQGSSVTTVTPQSTRSTATPLAVQTPSDPTKWAVVLSDKFTSNANDWNISSQQPNTTDYGTFRQTIANGKFRIEANVTKGVSNKYWPDIRAVSDFDLAVNAQRISGPTNVAYGVMFRRDDNGNFYVFQVRDDKTFAIFLYQGDWKTLKDWTASNAIKPAALNTIAVRGQGSRLTFSINNQSVADLNDNSVPRGMVGIALDIDSGIQATLEFSGFVLKAP